MTKFDQLIKHLNSDKYKEWFSNELIKMFFKTLKIAKKEGLTIDDMIECLDEQLR